MSKKVSNPEPPPGIAKPAPPPSPPMSAIDREIKGILGDAFDKYREGEKKYGELNIELDPRNFLKETVDEFLDAIVYIALEIARIRRVDAQLNKWILKAKTAPAQKSCIVCGRTISPETEFSNGIERSLCNRCYNWSIDTAKRLPRRLRRGPGDG